MITNCNKLKEILNTHNRKIVLAFDWGKTCTGVAVTDDKMQMILPCSPVIMSEAKNKKNFWAKLVADYNATSVVIGIPKHHDDKPNPTEDAIMEFANMLNAELLNAGFFAEKEIGIAFVNEAGTSKSAENLQFETTFADTVINGKRTRKTGGKNTRQKKRESLNSLSASLILERFIDKKSEFLLQ